MEGKIELLPEKALPKAKGVAVSAVKALGIPFIILIQIVFLSLLSFHLKLEQDLTTLSASIDKKERLLNQAKEVEALFRATQGKLEIIATVKEGFCYSCALEIIERIAPLSVIIKNGTFTEERFLFTATTAHGLSFSLFVSELFKEESIKEAAITAGSLCEKGLFTFTMELLFDKERVKK